MRYKKSLFELLERLNPLIEKGEYFDAGRIAENYGYMELAKKYYAHAEKEFKEKIILEQLKMETNQILKNISKYLPPLIKENNSKNEKFVSDSNLYQFYGIINELKKPFKKN